MLPKIDEESVAKSRLDAHAPGAPTKPLDAFAIK